MKYYYLIETTDNERSSSYKEICEITNQPRYSGNQKKAQLKEFLSTSKFLS